MCDFGFISWFFGYELAVIKSLNSIVVGAIPKSKFSEGVPRTAFPHSETEIPNGEALLRAYENEQNTKNSEISIPNSELETQNSWL